MARPAEPIPVDFPEARDEGANRSADA